MYQTLTAHAPAYQSRYNGHLRHLKGLKQQSRSATDRRSTDVSTRVNSTGEDIPTERSQCPFFDASFSQKPSFPHILTVYKKNNG